jgi:hypothetical protein
MLVGSASVIVLVVLVGVVVEVEEEVEGKGDITRHVVVFGPASDIIANPIIRRPGCPSYPSYPTRTAG